MADLPEGTTSPRGLPAPPNISWPLVPARELFALRYGKALVETRRRPGSTVVFGSNGPCGLHDRPLFKGPGVILGRKGQGPLGVKWSADDYWVIDTAYSLQPLTDLIDLRFAHHLISLIGLNHLKDGTSNPTLSREVFGSQAFPVPPLADQLKIASLLGSLNDKIELNRRMNETLEAIARAIFKDWFVDFGPTRAKTEGRTPYLAPDIWSLFPNRLDSEGKPEGWEMRTLSEFFSIIGGGTPKTTVAEYWNGDIPWFSVVDTPSDGSAFVHATEKSITLRGLEESSARLVSAGTTIITARGTVGNLAIAAQDMAFNQSCYALQGEGPVGGSFVFLAAKHMVGQLQTLAHGSVFSTITRQTFDALTLPKAPDAVFVAFEELVQCIFSKAKANGAESLKLATMRDLLLPKLMSGEIRLKDTENLVQEASPAHQDAEVA
jgi:type I restriction enzyme S subunit